MDEDLQNGGLEIEKILEGLSQESALALEAVIKALGENGIPKRDGRFEIPIQRIINAKAREIQEAINTLTAKAAPVLVRLRTGIDEKAPAAESPETTAGGKTRTSAALEVLRTSYRNFLAAIFAEVEKEPISTEMFKNFNLSIKGLRKSLEDSQAVLNAVAGETERITVSLEWEEFKSAFLDDMDKKIHLKDEKLLDLMERQALGDMKQLKAEQAGELIWILESIQTDLSVKAINSENILQVFEERKQAFMAAFDTVIQERKDLLNERLGLLAEESKKDGDFLKEFFENEIEAMRGEFLNPETGRLPLSGNAIVEFQKVLSRYEQAVPAEKRKSAKSKKLEIFIGKMKTDAESFPGVSPEREPGETVPAVLEEEKEQKAKDIADFGLAIDDYQGVLIKGRESFEARLSALNETIEKTKKADESQMLLEKRTALLEYLSVFAPDIEANQTRDGETFYAAQTIVDDLANRTIRLQNLLENLTPGFLDDETEKEIRQYHDELIGLNKRMREFYSWVVPPAGEEALRNILPPVFYRSVEDGTIEIPDAFKIHDSEDLLEEVRQSLDAAWQNIRRLEFTRNIALIAAGISGEYWVIPPQNFPNWI